MIRTAKRSMFLVFTLFILLGMTPPQLHAQDWTEVKMTDENVKQLAGLQFVAEETWDTTGITWLPTNSTRLSISADAKFATFDGGGGNRRKFKFRQAITVTGGKIALQLYRSLRTFTVYRNSAGKYRLSTRFDHENRNGFFDVRIVFTQE